jgi:hypothetical protein
MDMPRGIPLRPDYEATRHAAVGSLARACVAVARSASDLNSKKELAGDYARRTWRDDRTCELVLRAASSPATTTTAGWAAELAQIRTAFVAALTPVSAGADLLGRALQLSFDGAGKITVPGLTIPPAKFVRQGAPIPVGQGTSSAGPTLEPYLFGSIVSLTSEMLANANAEALVREALVVAAGTGLDQALFSNAAAVADERPPGLLYGITPLTPAAAGAKEEALVDDLATLAGALAPVAGNGSIVLIVPPQQTIALALRLVGAATWPVLTSSSLTAGTVIAVALNGFVSASGSAPQIEASREASLHYADPASDIVSAGGVAAAPVASLFQSDRVGLKLKWLLSWAVRDPRAVQFMTSVTW